MKCKNRKILSYFCNVYSLLRFLTMKYIPKRHVAGLLILALTLLSDAIYGQDVAVLPPDPAVKSGVLPNGITWYVATNTYVKGTADFALVQMTGSQTDAETDRETVVAIAQDALMSQPLLTAPSVQDYFIGKGCIPGPEGFVEVEDNATVFKFRNVNMKLSESVLDSTLLVLMNVAGRYCRSDDPVIRKWYAPADQAIIVAGDVDANTISEKLKMLSYMFPKSESVQRQGYVWENTPEISTEVCQGYEPGIVRVAARWKLERTPRELMNTVQPAIFRKYMTMTGMVARERILQELRERNISAASVDIDYVGGLGTIGDGEFSVEVAVSADDVLNATAVLAETLSSIDSYGVAPVEAGKASLDFVDMISSEVKRRDVANIEYVNRCVSAFVYNTSLSSMDDIRKFYLSKDISDDTESRLLFSIASNALDGEKNLTLRCTSDSLYVTADALKETFQNAWAQAAQEKPEFSNVLSVPFLPGTGPEVKVKSMKSEYLSGGSVWTLSNGMIIIFRNMKSESDAIHYSLSLNGGTGNVEGLGADDGQYLTDYLDNCKVSGVTGKEFRDALRRRGMKMNFEVGHSSTVIRGDVPSYELEYMLRALISMMNERTPDRTAWDYYLKCEALRQKASCASGNGACLNEGFADKAEAFFNSLSQNVNNGVLVLVGNIDEKKLKKALMAYAGNFKTTDKTFRRTETHTRSFSGIERYDRRGNGNSVNAVLTAPMAMTAENSYTAAITSMMLRRHFAQELAGKGMSVDVGYECRRFPQESVLMRVSVSEASSEGFASGTSEYSMGEALSVMRNAFSDLSQVKVDKAALASYKERLERQLAVAKETPEYWVSAINLRYLDGKDFTTGAENKIKSISEANVRAMLDVLGSNSKIEYVITGK